MSELDRGTIDDFLAKQSVGRLGLVGEKGRPLILPVHYLLEGQTVYFATEEGQRLSTLPQQNIVCFEVDEYLPELGRYRSVVAYGKARQIDDPDEQRRILRRLLERYERMGPLWASSRYYPAHAMSSQPIAQPLMVIAVTLEEATGRETGAA